MTAPNQQPTRTRRLASVALAVAALLLTIFVGIVLLTSPDDTVGDIDSVGAPSSAPGNPSTFDSVAAPGGDAGDVQERPDVIPPNEHTLLEAVAAPGHPVPVHLRIDAIDVSAPIVATGVDRSTGLMEVPANVDQVGWYEYGPVPGEIGSAVLAAHVDLAGRGPGVFFRLREIQPGDRVVVDFDDGTTLRFTVEGRTTYLKADLPVDAVFRRTGDPLLTLITCGGAFQESAGRYDSNIVVYATPDLPSGDPSRVG